MLVGISKSAGGGPCCAVTAIAKSNVSPRIAFFILVLPFFNSLARFPFVVADMRARLHCRLATSLHCTIVLLLRVVLIYAEYPHVPHGTGNTTQARSPCPVDQLHPVLAPALRLTPALPHSSGQ